MCNRLMMIFILSLMLVSCSGDKETKSDANGESGGNESSGAESAQAESPAETSGPKHWILSVPFKRIEKGSFKMGSPDGESGRGSDEAQVQVEITRPFEIMTL